MINIKALAHNLAKIYQNEVENQRFQMSIIQRDRDKSQKEQENIRDIDLKKQGVVQQEIEFENRSLEQRYLDQLKGYQDESLKIKSQQLSLNKKIQNFQK